MTYRWARHRVYDAGGNDKTGLSAISLLSVARAAAEETLQGSLLARPWLRLFATQTSATDTYWLRWRGDLAESAELRRAYSGLYGRFFARTLLTQHLRLSRFVSLKRNGISIPGSVDVVRQVKGDIPDWIAWDDLNSRFVLCEAKGSLTANDFLASGGPKCVHGGKAQFDRVSTFDGSVEIHPARWVAATRWATEQRKGDPVTILWDPPTEGGSYSGDEAERHRAAISTAWVASIAPGLGWDSPDELLSPEREREAVIVRVKPGPISPILEWPAFDDPFDTEEVLQPDVRKAVQVPSDRGIRRSIDTDNLLQSDLYSDRTALERTPHEQVVHEGAYSMALITGFGVTPIRTTADFDLLQRASERAQSLQEPAMLVGLPINFDPKEPTCAGGWRDDAGIAPTNGLAIFDLRVASVERLEQRLQT
jgi:hypothetical protein